MISNSRDKEHQGKQEGTSYEPKASASSSLWSTLRNPRVIRVSRLFGGKDRHSKVATIRGLRDRRVRLSMPTAIQLYDLQDKLGFNRPSKVVDWLLVAAQHEIDKLPPLQIPPGGDFIHEFTKSMARSSSHEVVPPHTLRRPSTIEITENSNNITHSSTFSYSMSNTNQISSNSSFAEDPGRSLKPTYWANSDVFLRSKEEQAKEWSTAKNDIVVREDEVDNQGVDTRRAPAGHSSLPGFLNSAMPYTSYYQPQAPDAYDSHFHSSQAEVTHNYYSTMMPPPSQPLTPASQAAFHTSGTMPSMFSPYPTFNSN